MLEPLSGPGAVVNCVYKQIEGYEKDFGSCNKNGAKM